MSRVGEHGDRGSVTVEFAVVLPLVVAVLVGALAASAVVDAHGRLVSAAATAARALGRGDAAAAGAAVDRIVPGATTSVDRRGGLVCVTATRSSASGLLPTVRATATACAADGGR